MNDASLEKGKVEAFTIYSSVSKRLKGFVATNRLLSLGLDFST